MRKKLKKQNVYIIGAKNCGAYGGFETFLDKLTEYHKNNDKILYYIAWKGNKKREFEYHGAHCFQIKVPNIGAAQAIYYDVAALRYCLKHIQRNHVEYPIIYILACRIGPFAAHFRKEIHKLGGKLCVNPDGHEWMREKWSLLVRKYWKQSERLMIKYADYLVCDSKNIEKYVKSAYKKYEPMTVHIAYGTDLAPSRLADDSPELIEWYAEKRLRKKQYYLIVGRFVPENSFETMIREFMKSATDRDLVIITTTNRCLWNELERKLHFEADPRIKFVGTVYNQELLKKIRENAYAYIHGHTVGGTNPSLIESLGSTDLNLLINVGFNLEVAEDCAFYWNKTEGSLEELIGKAESMYPAEIEEFGKRAKKRIAKEYTWKKIARQYEELFLGGFNQL